MAGRCVRISQVSEYESPERQKNLASSKTEEITYDLLGRVVKTVRTKKYAQLENSYVETETVSYGLDGVSKIVYLESVQHDGSTSLDIKHYDENGQLTLYEYETGGVKSRNEYTYTYFYYPEGETMPSSALTDPISQWMPVQLYGLAFE